MTTILTIILATIILFDFFMMTPFGFFWIAKNLNEGKPCYGIIIAFVTAIPAVFIGCFLGIIS